MFEPIGPRTSAVDSCAAALRRAVLSGEFGAGDKLPPERALSEQFGVNRVTVRSALGRLARERLVSVRQGSGYVVMNFRHTAGPDLLTELVRLGQGKDRTRVFADLLLVRRQIAHAVLERLAEGTTMHARQRIQHCIAEFRESVESGASVNELRARDHAVLAAVADAADSPVLQLCMNPVLAVAGELEELNAAIYADAQDSLAGWQALAVWLESPDPSLLSAMHAALLHRDEQTLARLQAH